MITLRLAALLEERIRSHMMHTKAPVIVITGPTGVGKSAVSIELALQLGGEIISADSRQIYRGMHIGTGAVTEQEMAGIPHHLIGMLDPREPYSAYDFKVQATACIEDIRSRGRLPILVGGTGLYLNTLIYDYTLEGQESFADEEKRMQIRTELEIEAGLQGAEAMHARLAAVDPESAESIHPNNVRYVLRALEVFALTGERKSERSRQVGGTYDFLLLGLRKEREALYAGIDQRHAQMFTDGLIEEVEDLVSAGYDGTLQSMRTIGYAEVLDYLAGNTTREECVQLVQQHARNYAKRQMTWFRKMPMMEWFDV